ncbi:MAG: tetratricopeptide repeat protein, partial [Bacteroidota bacterium]
MNLRYQLNPDSLFTTYYTLAQVYEQSKIDTALTYIDSAILLAPRLSDKSLRYKPFHFKGDLLMQKGEHVKAQEYYTTAHSFVESFKGRVTIKESEMSNLIQQDSINRALKLGKECELLVPQIEDDFYRNNLAAILYYNMGVIYNKKGNFSDAIDYYLKMEEVCIEGNLPQYFGALYNDLAELYNKSEDYDTAIQYYRKAKTNIPTDFVWLFMKVVGKVALGLRSRSRSYASSSDRIDSHAQFSEST